MMTTSYTFTLVLTGPVLDIDALEDRLFEAGCDDALLLVRDGVPYLEFDRQATSLLDALLSAIKDVNHARAGVTVVRVGPDDLVTAAEIARRTGRTKESIRLLVAGRRGPGGFPAPVRGVNQRVRLWRWADVAPWLAEHGALGDPPVDLEHANVIAAVNAALQLRRAAPDDPAGLLERIAG